MDFKEMLEFAKANGGKITIDFSEEKEPKVHASNSDGSIGMTRDLTVDGEVDNSQKDFDEQYADTERKVGIVSYEDRVKQQLKADKIEFMGEIHEADYLPSIVRAAKNMYGYDVSEIRMFQTSAGVMVTDLEGNDIQAAKVKEQPAQTIDDITPIPLRDVTMIPDEYTEEELDKLYYAPKTPHELYLVLEAKQAGKNVVADAINDCYIGGGIREFLGGELIQKLDNELSKKLRTLMPTVPEETMDTALRAITLGLSSATNNAGEGWLDYHVEWLDRLSEDFCCPGHAMVTRMAITREAGSMEQAMWFFSLLGDGKGVTDVLRSVTELDEDKIPEWLHGQETEDAGVVALATLSLAYTLRRLFMVGLELAIRTAGDDMSDEEATMIDDLVGAMGSTLDLRAFSVVAIDFVQQVLHDHLVEIDTDQLEQLFTYWMAHLEEEVQKEQMGTITERVKEEEDEETVDGTDLLSAGLDLIREIVGDKLDDNSSDSLLLSNWVKAPVEEVAAYQIDRATELAALEEYREQVISFEMPDAKDISDAMGTMALVVAVVPVFAEMSIAKAIDPSRIPSDDIFKAVLTQLIKTEAQQMRITESIRVQKKWDAVPVHVFEELTDVYPTIRSKRVAALTHIVKHELHEINQLADHLYTKLYDYMKEVNTKVEPYNVKQYGDTLRAALVGCHMLYRIIDRVEKLAPERPTMVIPEVIDDPLEVDSAKSMTEITKQAIVKAYKSGETIKDIKTWYNLGSSGELYAVLDEYKVPRRNTRVASSKVAGKVKHITDNKDVLQALIRDYTAGEMTLEAIYSEYDLYKNGLYYILDKYNVARRTKR